MRTILISGFEAFHTHSYNVTEMLVRWLDSQHQSGFSIRTIILPVVRWTSVQILSSAIKAHNPAAIIALGQSRRPEISLERVAINRDHFKIADNAGHQPLNSPIRADGPEQYLSTLPLEALLNALHKTRIPTQYSDTAGTYVCNHLFYGLMDHLRTSSVPAGFIHLPHSEAQTATAYLKSQDFERQKTAMTTIIEAMAKQLSH